MNEIFKDCFEYKNYYQVSNLGRIFSKRSNKIIKTIVDNRGYESFTTKFEGRNSKTFNLKIHRLVAKTFLNLIENKLEVNHIDGNKLNNKLQNLEWCNHSENILHAHSLRLITRLEGENNPQAKLTNEQVIQIKELYVPKIFGILKIAKLLNVSQSTVYNVIKNRA